jgi:hypothetical protein
MKPDDHTLIYELSDDALETVVSIEQVPTILNASYCLTCPSWESEEEQAFRAVTTLGSSSAAAPPSSEYAKGAMLESSENGESCHSSDLIRSNDTSIDKFYRCVSDDALEAAADMHHIWGNNTLGLTLVMPLAPPPCC